MKKAVIEEVVEIGWPRSIIYRCGKPITELILTEELIRELGIGYLKHHNITAE